MCMWVNNVNWLSTSEVSDRGTHDSWTFRLASTSTYMYTAVVQLKVTANTIARIWSQSIDTSGGWLNLNLYGLHYICICNDIHCLVNLLRRERCIFTPPKHTGEKMARELCAINAIHPECTWYLIKSQGQSYHNTLKFRLQDQCILKQTAP